MEAAVLALLGAVSWGTGDFFGGLASRRAHVLTVLVVSQAVGLVGVATWAIVRGDAPPGLADILPAVGAGAAGAAGLAALYRGMAIGAMGIVAPISAVSPAVPLGVDLLRGDAPAALQWAGIATALAGVVLLAREPSGARGGRAGLAAGVSLALVAALGFGLFIVGIDGASDGGATWAVVVARASSSTSSRSARCSSRPCHFARRRAYSRRSWRSGCSTRPRTCSSPSRRRTGRLGIVAVLSALYPLTTILLARDLPLRAPRSHPPGGRRARPCRRRARRGGMSRLRR